MGGVRYEGTTYLSSVQPASIIIGALIASFSRSYTPTRCVHMQQLHMTGDSLSSFSFDIQLQLFNLLILFPFTTCCSIG